MIKPLLMIPLLAQLSVAPSIGDGNVAPAIGEAPPPAEPESQSEPVAVRLESQPIEPPSDSINLPVSDPPLEPPAEDPSDDLAPPLEQPALEDSSPPQRRNHYQKKNPIPQSHQPHRRPKFLLSHFYLLNPSHKDRSLRGLPTINPTPPFRSALKRLATH